MSDERFLVTGAMGCLGAWIVRLLLDESTPVIAFDLSRNATRLRLLATDEELAGLTIVTGDITEPGPIARVVADYGITHVIHCAALQVPFVRADPAAGARVNVLGTVNVFEAVQRASGSVRGLAYASSAAVFGPPERYRDGIVTDDSALFPENNLYGVYKQTNEGTAKVYSNEGGIGSIGLRPFIVYGPGRDQGMTSSPTLAMAAAVAGKRYQITFGGGLYVHYAPDAAAAFISAARRATTEARLFNVPGTTIQMTELVGAIEKADPRTRGLVTVADDSLRSPSKVDVTRVNAVLGPLPITPLGEGVAQTMAILAKGLARGIVAVPGS